jgi:hypothetical protein
MKNDILKELFFAEAAGYDDNGSESPEYSSNDLGEEMEKYIPDPEAYNRVSSAVFNYAGAYAQESFKRGVRFAVSFMIEAMRPQEAE